MIIFKEVQTALKARLKTIEGIKKTDWFNNQYQNTEDEKATRYPAVYIEFLEPVNWVQNGRQWQHARIRIRLHIVLYDIKDSPVRALEFGQKVFEAVNSKRLMGDDVQLTTELVREATTFPKRYNQLKVIEMDFGCEVFDSTGMPRMQEVPAPDFVINP